MSSFEFIERPSNSSQLFIEDPSSKKLYLIMKKFGNGAFGDVYKVLDKKNNLYAIKKISKIDGELHCTYVKRCENEIRIHKQLDHPNICKLIHHFIGIDSIYYLVLEACREETLSTFIKSRKNITEREARYILLDLLSALSYLREKHIVHRDLKPENVLLGFGDNICVKICDFGLATELSSDQETSRDYCGTEEYMAPEIARNTNEAYRYEVDIWSLGIILYKLVIGFVPYEGYEYKRERRIAKIICKFGLAFPVNKYKITDDFKSCVIYMLSSTQKTRPTIDQIKEHRFLKHAIPKNIFCTAIYGKPMFNKGNLIRLHENEDYQISIDSTFSVEDIETPDINESNHENSPNTPTMDASPPLHTLSITRLSSSDLNDGCSFCSTQGCDMCALHD
jgi:serine/threonine protein kinase